MSRARTRLNMMWLCGLCGSPDVGSLYPTELRATRDLRTCEKLCEGESVASNHRKLNASTFEPAATAMY